MNENNDETPVIINEIINDSPILLAVREKVEEPTPLPVKVKKPRSEKQIEALKKMLIKRQEIAVVQRADRKERRAPKWYRELNAQDKEIQEMKSIIDMLKGQLIEDRYVPEHYSLPDVVNEPLVEPIAEEKSGLIDGVYYHKKTIAKVLEAREILPMRHFGPNDRLSLLRHVL